MAATDRAAELRKRAMFLSDFSIKRPVSTVVIIIALMCLGLLALKKLRVNQIPDVEQPVMVVNIPYPGRLARDGGARDHQPRREVAAEHPAGLPDPLDRQREPARRSSSSSTSRRTWSRRPTRSATRSPRCATSCRWRCASRSCTRIDPSAQPIMQLALSSHDAVARGDLAPGRRHARRPLPRHRRRGGGERERRRCAASSRCCCAPRSCASTTSR